MARHTRGRRLLAAIVTALTVGAIALAPSAFAQTGSSDDGILQIRQLDARDPAATAVTFSWSGDPAAVEGLTVEDGGEEVAVEPPRQLDGRIALVLTVDTSQAMNGAALVEAKAALSQMVEDRPENSVVALVSFAEQPVVEQDFTNDDARLIAAIDGLAASGPTALWNGVGTAAQLFDGAPPGSQHNLVLVSGGPDQGSTTTPSRARGEVTDADAFVYAVGVGGGADASALQGVATSSGGVFVATDPDGVTEALVTADTMLSQQYEVVWDRGEDPSNASDLTLQIGETTARASFVDGGVMGGSQLAPREEAEPSGFSALQTEPFKLLAVVGVLLAVSLGVYALVSAFTKDPSGLETVLSPYGEGYAPGASSDPDDEDSALAKSAILQRAVDLTEQIAEKRGFLGTAETQLERANLPLRAAEALFFYAAFVLVAFL
ncbi:hypothetical protein B7486_55250, partial [cyanobacterium TDX16]